MRAPVPLGDPREGPRGPLGIGLGAQRRVDGAEERRAQGGLEAPGVADAEQLDHMPLRAERRHAVAREVVLGRGVDGLERARLPELDVLAMIERHLLEQVEAARGEVGLQIRRMAPAGRIDHARIDARRARGDLAPLEHRDAAAVQREVERRGCARDASAHDRDIRVPRALPRHDPGSVAHLRVPGRTGRLAVSTRSAAPSRDGSRGALATVLRARLDEAHAGDRRSVTGSRACVAQPPARGRGPIRARRIARRGLARDLPRGERGAARVGGLAHPRGLGRRPRLLLSRLVLDHRLTARDPLAPAAGTADAQAAALLLDDRAVPMAQPPRSPRDRGVLPDAGVSYPSR